MSIEEKAKEHREQSCLEPEACYDSACFESGYQSRDEEVNALWGMLGRSVELIRQAVNGEMSNLDSADYYEDFEKLRKERGI